SSALKNGRYNGSKTVQKYQAAIYKDFVMRLDRADKPNPNASNGDKPVDAINDAAATLAGKAVKIDVLDNDKAADGGLKIAGFDVASAKGGKIALNSDGTLTYTPKAGYVGNDSFAYKARNVDGDIDTASV